MLAFHPAITLAAFLLAWASTVVPAWVAAKRKLRDKPASYFGHFMFMTSGGYKHVFGEQHQSNAYMVRLRTTRPQCGVAQLKLMKLDGVKASCRTRPQRNSMLGALKSVE